MIRRGEIWWAALPSPRGAEPGYRRPVVVVQADPFNRSRLQIVIAAVITSNLRLAEAPGNVRLTRRQSRLAKESVINVSQLVTLDRETHHSASHAPARADHREAKTHSELA